ncbi:hypothetical protein Q1695_016448 [Nippostrongylus brasiliensis]|nr:hypothetical protein Q1695_016448 [Nippostrongylus brasiliensis]
MQSKIDALRNMLSHNRDEIAALKQQVADVELKRKQEWDRQVEKENEVYDEKARAEKALEKKVEQLAGDANHKPLEEDRKRVIPEPRRGGKVGVVYDALHRTTTRLPPVQLPICKRRSNYSNAYGDVQLRIQMLDLYNVIDFENVDGGAWKQGWEITYDSHKVVEEKTLEVIVIPHSHCDPGWLKTFEEYYHSQAKNILNGMVNHLGEKQKDMRFIYAEMSFFEMWWREQTDEVKTKVKSLLTSGALEIVTGGWVMTDEANAHYFSIITELMEGHEFLRNHIGYTPTTHWSIDPFGLSPTLPYLLSASNISNAAVQRVHYSVKKYLAKNKQLEFMWRQLWGSHGKRDIRTHMFPFYSYDIPHSCGPDPSVCCQFDFARLPGGHYTCPWGKNPEKITPSNVAERAVVLCDQYRKKSQLYQTNVLLVPLGDDFRYDFISSLYDTNFEWENHYNNYKLLFEEMNKNKDCNIHARFGTLNDYFVELDRSLRADQKVLPVLSGDFFTYADRDDHYWSGYFTSRPFYKQMDRALVQQLRAAEIAFSLQSMKSEVSVSDEAFIRLVEARRALSLFQHHDGVTGTARDEVVVDYGKKMLNALAGVEKVLSEAVSSLINSEAISATSLLVDEYRLEQDSLPVRRSYKIGEFVVLLNTLSRSRDEPICIYVSSIKAAVRPLDNREIRQQISPIFRLNNLTLAAMDIYEVCFIDTLKPFGVSIYEVVESSVDSRPSFATISANAGVTVKEFKAEQIRGDTLTLKNSEVEATFSSLNGFLKSVTPNGHKEIDVEVKFVHYGVRSPGMIKNSGGDNLSGAYLFLPDGQAKEFRQRNSNFVVVDGPLMKRVYVVGPSELKILQVYSLPEGSPSVLITNEVDIR